MSCHPICFARALASQGDVSSPTKGLWLMAQLWREIQKIDQSMPIVVETEQIQHPRNSPLKSRAQISGGSEIRSFALRKKLH
jgi:hypothetical protein